MQSFCSHCFASIIGVLPPQPLPLLPPLSLRHSAHMSNDMTSECSAWTATSPKSSSWIIEVDVYLWGPFLPFPWQATLKKQDCEHEKGRGGYANGLQDKKKNKKTTDWFETHSRLGGTSAGIAADWEAWAWWDFFCCCLLECGLILLLFCSHGQAKKKNAQEVWCK